MASFGITTPTAMLDKLFEEQRDFESGHCLSARHAINATMTAYHLHEWVWGAFAKGRPDLHQEWQLSPGKKANREDFLSWVEQQCPAIADAQSVTNGMKHFNPAAIQTGEHKGGFQAGVFQSNGFDVSHLWIERNGVKQRAEEFINELVKFWRDEFFAKYNVP
jgi:hypothetical protein